jgi:hypothetical protein
MSPYRRLVAAASCFSAWMVLLLLGHSLGPFVHLLAVAALLLFPWNAARVDPDATSNQPPEGGK